MNSILSIRPVSIAAMRTFRANGEAGEKVSFIFLVSLLRSRHPRATAKPLSLEVRALREPRRMTVSWPILRDARRRRAPQDDGVPSRRDDFLALLAEAFDAEGYDVADVEELRRLHACADAGRRACGD